MALEDLSLFTEVDPSNRISIAAGVVTGTTISRNVTNYLYFDYGADHFSGDFVHRFKTRMTGSGSSSFGRGVVWMLSNALSHGIGTWPNVHITWNSGADQVTRTLQLCQQEASGNPTNLDTSITLSGSTNYWCEVERDEAVGTYGTMYLRIYSDSGFTTLVDTLTITLNTAQYDFRYLFALNCYNNGATSHVSFEVSELDLQEIALDYTAINSGDIIPMSRPILKGSTDQSSVIRITDALDGSPETGVVAATSGLDLQYRREGAAAVALTESDLAAVSSAHSDGGIKHIGGGYYRVDLPDAAVASGADGVLVFGTVTGMRVQGSYHPLIAVNLQDADGLGLSRLDAAMSTRATPIQVNTEVLDVLNVDTFAEPGQGNPPATASLAAKINYLFKGWRNKKENDGDEVKLYNDAGTVVDQKAAVSATPSLVEHEKFVTGP